MYIKKGLIVWTSPFLMGLLSIDMLFSNNVGVK